MTLVQIGETFINPDRIAYVQRIESLPFGSVDKPGTPRVLGASIHFDGGSKVEIHHPKALEALVRWVSDQGHPIQVAPLGSGPGVQPSIKVFGNTGGGSGTTAISDPVIPPAQP